MKYLVYTLLIFSFYSTFASHEINIKSGGDVTVGDNNNSIKGDYNTIEKDGSNNNISVEGQQQNQDQGNYIIDSQGNVSMGNLNKSIVGNSNTISEKNSGNTIDIDGFPSGAYYLIGVLLVVGILMFLYIKYGKYLDKK